MKQKQSSHRFDFKSLNQMGSNPSHQGCYSHSPKSEAAGPHNVLEYFREEIATWQSQTLSLPITTEALEVAGSANSESASSLDSQ